MWEINASRVNLVWRRGCGPSCHFQYLVAFQSVDEFMAWAPMAPVLLRRFILSDFVGAFLRL
jgi:hypothetical protein